MAEQPPAESRYRAFLSYSHKDAAAAGRLHRRLEAYRMPRRLAGKMTARGPVPDRLWPIFRDREELPAATDLSETVRDALAQSQSLIVLCSHHAATSLWVAEEIETFRALHPDRPILAAILDGDPPDCFPAALRAFGPDGRSHEPLATDLRPSGDGPGLGLLKLVAGITGVGLDDLVQRDAARKVRRVTAVTGAALIAVLVMAALTWVALDARREAERQRAAAEGQIEFMLTDLRTRLRGVGRLDIMAAVNAHALRYYGGQSELSALPPESLFRRVRILHSIGEDDITLGNFEGALAAYREAQRTTAEQISRSPNDPERLFEHARSEYRIGRVFESRGQWTQAQQQYSRAAAAADRLIALVPDNPDYMMVVGSTATDLGNVELHRNHNPIAAQHYYEKAGRWYGRAASARPDNLDAARAHANAYANLADAFFMREQWRQSLETRLRQYRIVERLQRADPADMENGYRLALARRGVAASLVKLGNLQRARSHLLEAYAWSGRAVRHDERNAEWLLFRAIVGCELYYRIPDLPRGMSRVQLGNDIRAAASELRSQHNPRAATLSNCIRALN